MRKMLLFVMAICSITMMAQQTRNHTVQRGETLESIASKYNVTVADIKAANPAAADFFYVGMSLDIPIKSSVSTNQSQPEMVSPTQQQTGAILQNTTTYDTSQQQSNKSSQSGLDKGYLWHIGYYNTLKSGDKGAYGFGGDGIDDDQGLGMSMRVATNAFLVDSDFISFQFSLGANYNIRLGEYGCFVFPIMFNLQSYSEITYNENRGKTDKKTKIGTGILISPYIALGKKAGITIGPTWSHSFVNDNSSWGGYIGIWF